MKKKITNKQVKIYLSEGFDGSQETDSTKPVINIHIENPTAVNVEDLKSQIDKAINKALINFNIN